MAGDKMKIFQHLMEKSRLRKHEQFMDFCKPTSKDKILDVGVQNDEYKESDNFLERKYPYRTNITALGVEKLKDFSKRYPEVRAVTYGGKIFPFKNKSFDFVWSNAVLEHVGKRLRQELFISEMLRVAKRKVVFTTPNRNFPVELHTKLPFVHWLKKENADRIYTKLGKKWATGDYMYLLNKKDLVALLIGMNKKYFFEYKIVNNRMLGFTATFTVLVNKK